MTQQEFDTHAKTYNEVLDDSISFSGADSAYFAEYKIKDLHRELAALHYGCRLGQKCPTRPFRTGQP